MNCEECGYVWCDKCKGITPPKKSFLSRHKGKIIGLVLVLFFVVFPVFAVIGFFASLGDEIAREEDKERIVSGSGDDVIALVNVSGIIVDNEPNQGFAAFSEELASSRRLKKVFEDIKNDSDVRAVLLKVNSPGGSAAAAEDILQDIKSFKAQTNKKVVVYFSDIAASGGYYIAMGGDHIVANPSSITGSIGVIISYLNFGELARSYGVTDITYKSGEHKDIVSEFRQPSPEERQIMQSLVDDAYNNFVIAVSQGRGLPESEVEYLGDGRVYSAVQARDNKLIDSVGTFEDAVSKTRELSGLQNATVIEYGQVGFWESLLGSVSPKLNLQVLPGKMYFDSTPGARLLYLYAP